MSDLDHMNALARECHEYKAQRDAALAEAGRLRAVLEGLLSELSSPPVDRPRAWEIVREALLQ